MFKTGDYIKCIDNHYSELTYGKSYVALRFASTSFNLGLVYVINNMGVQTSYFNSRFVLDIKETRKKKLLRCIEKEI